MEEKKINPMFNQNSFIPSNESNVFINILLKFNFAFGIFINIYKINYQRK